MTHLRPASTKLRERAERILMALADVDREEAARLLDRTEGDIAGAVELARR